MALADKKYEGLHNKTGTELARIKAEFDNGIHLNLIDFPAEAALIYQMQKMQDELDALRTEISANKDKAGTETTLATTRVEDSPFHMPYGNNTLIIKVKHDKPLFLFMACC